MIKQARRDYLRVDEIEKLLSAARKTRNPERDYALVLVTFRHALRVSEACGVVNLRTFVEGRLEL
jgi:integrase